MFDHIMHLQTTDTNQECHEASSKKMNTFTLEHMILMLFQCSFFCGWPHDTPDYINSS